MMRIVKIKACAAYLGILFCLLICCSCGARSDSVSDSTSGTAASGGISSEEITGSSSESMLDSASDSALTPCEQTVTLMVYMTGSDLESKSGAATNDLGEMAESGVDLNQVNLVVYTGGSEQWQNGISSDENTVLTLGEYGFSPVETFAQESMGEADSLSRFLNYAYENYPADSYELILWDHGNGPLMGYGIDTQYDRDSLTLPEMKEALAASPFNQDNKLGFIGFDACLMSSAELACTLSEYAKYLVASQEVEPNFGWNYEFLSQCGHIDDRSLARLAADDYLDYCETYFSEHENFNSDVTMACIDLSHAEELETAVNALFAEAAEDVSGDYNILAVERVNTRALGRATTGSEYDLVDINDLMECMSEKYPEETAAVQSVLENMVVQSDTNTTRCCGMSIYYPYYNKDYYTDSWKENYSDIGLFSDYRSYLERYEQIWLGTDMQDYFSEPLTPEEYEPGSFSLQLTDQQAECYAYGGYYILERVGDGIYREVGYNTGVTMENGKLTADFDGRSLVCTNDYGDSFRIDTVLTDSRDNVEYFTLSYTMSTACFSASAIENKIASYELQLAVNIDTYETTVVGLYYSGSNNSQDGSMETGKMEPVDLNEWKVMYFKYATPCYPTRNESGVLLPYDEWTEGEWQIMNEAAVADGLHFSYEPFYDDGNEYFLMFDISDVQGNSYSSELMPVTLANAPETEEASEPVDEMEWTEENDSMEIADSGIVVRAIASCDPDTGAPLYGVELTNTNDFKVTAELDDFVVNGAYQALTDDSRETNIYSLDAGGTTQLMISSIQNTIAASGASGLSALSFEITAHRYVDNSILIHGRRIDITANNITPEPYWTSIFGISAEEQILWQNDDITITLETCGMTPCSSSTISSESLTCMIKTENHSDSSYELNIPGASCGEISVSTDSSGIGNDILPHSTDVFEIVFEEAWLEMLDVRSVPAMELYLSLENTSDGSSTFCGMVPVELSNSSTDDSCASPTEGAAILYEDNNVKVLDYGEVRKDIYVTEYRAVLVMNKTDDILRLGSPDMISSDGSTISSYQNSLEGTNVIMPGAVGLMYFRTDNGQDNEDDSDEFRFPAFSLKLYLAIEDSAGNYDVSTEIDTDLFTVPEFSKGENS